MRKYLYFSIKYVGMKKNGLNYTLGCYILFRDALQAFIR